MILEASLFEKLIILTVIIHIIDTLSYYNELSMLRDMDFYIWL